MIKRVPLNNGFIWSSEAVLLFIQQEPFLLPEFHMSLEDYLFKTIPELVNATDILFDTKFW